MTVLERVERERQRASVVMSLRAAGFAAAMILAVLGAGVLLLGGTRWLHLPPLLPFLIWAVALAALAGIVIIARRIRRRDASMAAMASAIETERQLRVGSLRGALEIGPDTPLGRLALTQLAPQVESGALAPRLHARLVQRAAIAAGAAAVAGLLFAGAASARPDGWLAIAHPVKAWNGALLLPLSIDAPRVVTRGERLALRVRASGHRSIDVTSRASGSAWRTDHVDVRDGVARLELGPVDAAMTIVATDGRATSDTVRVGVTDRPFVGDIALVASYPAYLGRPAEPLAIGEIARVPRGTTIRVSGRASSALDAVVLQSARESSPLVVDGHRFTGRLLAEQSGRWTWRATSSGAAILDLPNPIELEVIPDSAPRVEILAPSRDTLVTAGDRIAISIVAADDHGLSAVTLRSWRDRGASSALPSAEQLLARDAGGQWNGAATMDLASRGVEAGEALHVVVEAVDGSPWHQRATSRELILRVPSLAEQRVLARATGDSAGRAAAALAAAERQLQQKTGEAARSRGERNAQTERRDSLRRDPTRPPSSPLGFEGAEQAKALAAEQRQLAEKVKTLGDAAQQLERQLKQAGALDSALSQRLRDAERLLRDALTPELAEQLKKLDESAKGLDREAARQSLADLAAQQQRLREQLERGAEMLKRAALEGAMATLRDEAKELASKDSALVDSLAGKRSAGKDTGSVESPKELAERSRQLEKDVASLADRLQKEGAPTGSRLANDARNAADKSADAMEQVAQSSPSSPSSANSAQGQSRSGQNGAQQNANRAAQQMSEAARQLSRARESQVSEWKEELTSQLDRSIQETLQLSRQEQELADRAQAGNDRAGIRSDQSALQQGVDKANDRVQRAAKSSSLVSPGAQRAMNDARAKVAQATRETAEANSPLTSSAAMREAAEALNRAASALVRDRERTASAKSASGFSEMLEQLQQLAKQQGGLASQMSGLSLGQNGQLSEQGRAEARALGKQQRQLAQSLQELGDGDGTGRTDALAREAKQIADAMERGVVDASVIDRQQRLYRRLLDAGRSMEKEDREDTGTREARAANDAGVFTPGAATPSNAAQRFRAPAWDELRGLSADERRVIMEYFRRLNATP